MDPLVWKFGLWMMVLVVVLFATGAIIWHLRQTIVSDDRDDADEPALLTTAQVDRLKSEGLLSDEQYVKLRTEAFEAAKKRADLAKKRGNKKRGLLG